MNKSITLQKVYLLILVRFILILGYLVAILIGQEELVNIHALLHNNAGLLLFSYFAINVFYLFLTRFIQGFLQTFITIQIMIDLLVETFLIYLTGGVLSIFVSLYFCSILTAGILVAPHLSILCASLSTVGISTVALAYFVAAINYIHLPLIPQSTLYPFIENDFPFLKAYLFSQCMAFHIVAFFMKQFTSAVSHQKILHEEILENLTDGVLVIDSRQNIIFINRQAHEILALDQQMNWQGKSIIQILNPTNHGEMLKCLMMQRTLKLEIELKYDKKIVPVQLIISAFSTTKKIQSYIIILQDISEQRQMRQAIKRANRLKTISEMASTIAHEIRNPLASIRGSVQELKSIVKPDDSRYILMEIAIKESDRINGIISDFLKFSKVRSPFFRKVNMSQLLHEVIFFTQQRKEMSHAYIQMDIEPEMYAVVDSEQLRQVFYNLAINAQEASIGQLELTIVAQSCKLSEFSATPYQYNFSNPGQDGIEIHFADKGKGIVSEKLEKIFTPFFTTKEHGTGMGLALVSKILDMHSALYYMTSVPGQSTVFTIWLPSELKTGI